MDAKASIVALFLSLFSLWPAGCVETPLTGPPSSESAGLDVNDPSTASVSGHLVVGSAAAKQVSELQRQVVDPAAAASEFGAVIPGELLVAFDPSLSQEERAAILAESGMEEIECSPSGVCRVAGPPRPQVDPRQAKSATVGDADALLNRPGVLRASANMRRYIARAPDDKHFPVQWHYSLINLPQAWDLTTGSDEIVVAVVDTGVVSSHPDLQGRLVPGYDFISNPATARDGDGRDADPEDMGDEYNGPGRSSFHGTHVCGTLGAATNNAMGVAGVTWSTRIMPVRALGVDGGTSFDLAEAIRFAAGLPNVSGTVPAVPARIINLSVAGEPGEPPAREEIAAIRDVTRAGVLVICAAGNNGSSEPTWPAASPEAICVGAVDIQTARPGYSNYGSTLDLMGPGGVGGQDVNGDGFPDSVLSTGATDSSGRVETKYIFNNGTSMAAPHVAGVAALMLAVNPSLSATDLRWILESTARDLGSPGRDDEYGHGLVDAAAAVGEALRLAGDPGSTPRPPTEAPDVPGAEQIYVLALEAGTWTPVAQDETSVARDYAYELRGLPPGTYAIYAGTDRNGDGFICDEGDLCGAMPAVTAPEPLNVEAGDRLSDVVLPMTELGAGGSEGQVQPLRLPRVR